MRVWTLKNGDFRFFHSLSSEHFTYMATQQPLRDASVDDLSDISRSLDCFTSNFSRAVRDTAKVTIETTNNRKSYTSFRLVPLLMTLNDTRRSFHPPKSNISEII